MSIVKTVVKTDLYTWKCPKCRKRIETNYERATENAAAKHLAWHEKREEKQHHWAATVQAEVEGVTQ